MNLMMREQVQAELLDQDNPLGFPETYPFIFNVKLYDFKRKTDMNLKYKYHLRSVSNF
jgi:hypothetical protein